MKTIKLAFVHDEDASVADVVKIDGVSVLPEIINYAEDAVVWNKAHFNMQKSVLELMKELEQEEMDIFTKAATAVMLGAYLCKNCPGHKMNIEREMISADEDTFSGFIEFEYKHIYSLVSNETLAALITLVCLGTITTLLNVTSN